MKKVIAAIGGGLLGSLLLVATVTAANPTATPSPSATPDTRGDVVANVLGLTHAQIMDLRHDGLSLAQIATQQKVEVQKVVDALVAQWRERIADRLEDGAITSAEAATLQTQLSTQAQAMVNKTTLGGMQGRAVGGGRGNGGNGMGNGMGDGSCDGTGTRGAGRP
jgi:hypothetical protein